MSGFKIGDRVRITGNGNDSANNVGDVGVIFDGPSPSGNWAVDAGNGKFSVWTRPNDMELLTNGDNTVKERSTYRLLKGTAELKVGAVVQEKCDDGDQDYIVLDESFVKYVNEDNSRKYTLPREAVEKEPKWFVEVFKVHPEYMTREELDDWEEFKKTRTTKKATTRKPRKARTKSTK